jgi:hypothetical protein
MLHPAVGIVRRIGTSSGRVEVDRGDDHGLRVREGVWVCSHRERRASVGNVCYADEVCECGE